MSLLLRKLKHLLIVRQVEGDSMVPSLRAGQIVVASSLKVPKLGDIVVAQLSSGREVIKQLSVSADVGQKFMLLSVNPAGASYGSQQVNDLYGKVIWPRI